MPLPPFASISGRKFDAETGVAREFRGNTVVAFIGDVEPNSTPPPTRTQLIEHLGEHVDQQRYYSESLTDPHIERNLDGGGSSSFFGREVLRETVRVFREALDPSPPLALADSARAAASANDDTNKNGENSATHRDYLFNYMPEDTWHMTVFDLLCEQARGGGSADAEIWDGLRGPSSPSSGDKMKKEEDAATTISEKDTAQALLNDDGSGSAAPIAPATKPMFPILKTQKDADALMLARVAPVLASAAIAYNHSVHAPHQGYNLRLVELSSDGYTLHVRLTDDGPTNDPTTMGSEHLSLRRIRDDLSAATGVRKPDHESYRFHITLAYQISDVDQLGLRPNVNAATMAAARYLASVTRGKRLLFARAPEFVRFNSMTTVLPAMSRGV